MYRNEWIATRHLPMGLRRRYLYRRAHGCWPNLTSPRKFSEKVNWRILNDRRPLLAPTCDKLASRAFAQEVSKVSVPDLYWTGTEVDELASVDLPERWILKPNHRSALVYFGHGPANVGDLRLRTKGWLDETYSHHWGEWAYANAKRTLLVEQWLGEGDSSILDYRFFVFHGRCHLIVVDADCLDVVRRRRGIYRPDWTPLTATNHWPRDEVRPPPFRLQEMISEAEELGRDFDMMRVDLYEVDGAIYFGELTPYPSGGLKHFDPVDLDYELGDQWRLPDLRLQRDLHRKPTLRIR